MNHSEQTGENRRPVLSMAPMQGVTGYVYRNAHKAVFGAMDRYYTPFFSNTGFSKKEEHEILPANNAGMRLIPQILTNKVDTFLSLARLFVDLGYKELNLNLGCPSGTVTAKFKGSGFLRDPEGLRFFLDDVFRESPLPISLKTRIGYAKEEEWPALWSMFCEYPFTEVIIHPRLKDDQYKGAVRKEAFAYAMEHAADASFSGHIVYNGDICDPADAAEILRAYPTVEGLMLGRGMITDPSLPNRILGAGPLTNRQMGDFLDYLRDGYEKEIPEERCVLARLNEVWSYLCFLFPEPDRIRRGLRKCRSIAEYRAFVSGVLMESPETLSLT